MLRLLALDVVLVATARPPAHPIATLMTDARASSGSDDERTAGPSSAPTMEERKAKMEELRSRLVRPPPARAGPGLTAC
jgi:hypothetical protein